VFVFTNPSNAYLLIRTVAKARKIQQPNIEQVLSVECVLGYYTVCPYLFRGKVYLLCIDDNYTSQKTHVRPLQALKGIALLVFSRAKLVPHRKHVGPPHPVRC
jgi:hypothetical protein